MIIFIITLKLPAFLIYLVIEILGSFRRAWIKARNLTLSPPLKTYPLEKLS